MNNFFSITYFLGVQKKRFITCFGCQIRKLHFKMYPYLDACTMFHMISAHYTKIPIIHTGLDNQNFQPAIVNIFLPVILSICLGAQKNRLIETVLLSTHNICFNCDIRKLYFNIYPYLDPCTMFHMISAHYTKIPVIEGELSPHRGRA